MKENMTSCPVCGSALKQDFCPRCLYLSPLQVRKKGENRDPDEILNTGPSMIGHYYLVDLITTGEGELSTETETAVWRRLEHQEDQLLRIVAGFENPGIIDIDRFDEAEAVSGDSFNERRENGERVFDEKAQIKREDGMDLREYEDARYQVETEVTVSDFDSMASLIAENHEEDRFSDRFMSGLLEETEEDSFPDALSPDEGGWGEDQIIGRSEEIRATDCITDVLDENGDIVSPIGEKERDLFSDRDHPVRMERENLLRRERRDRQLRSGKHDNNSKIQTQLHENYASGMVRPGVFSSAEFTYSDYYDNFSGMISENPRDFIYSEMLENDSSDENLFESSRKNRGNQDKQEKSGLFGKRKTERSQKNKEIKEDNYQFIDKNVDSYYLDKDMPDDLDDRLEKKRMSKDQMKQAAIFGSVAMLGIGMMVVPFL